MIGSLLALVSLVPATPTEGKVVAASLFKNGYAVVVREAELTEGEVAFKPPTNAVLGTLWISASKGVTISKVATESIETIGQRDAVSIDELLTANFEKNVTLETSQGNSSQTTVVKGRVISSEGSMVVLEGTNERIALFKSSILRVVAAEHGLNFRVPTKTNTNVIRIKASGSGKVYLVSLQRGMTWAPAYQVDLLTEKTLKLTAKATILNDLAPLDNVAVNLVTGFPNIRYINALDPLSSGYSVDQFVQGLTYAVTENEFKRDALSQNAAPALSGGFGEAMQPTGTGQQLEDLFLYKQPNVTLKAGERGYYILFAADSDYESVYTADIPDTDLTPAPFTGGGIEEQAPLDVWHTLKFDNKSGQPLTTGPVTTMKDGEILGQDLLKYTTARSEARVRVTKALDIHAESLVEETARERGFVRNQISPIYDRVTLKGTIEITNLKPKTVQMIVTKVASGDVTGAGNAVVTKKPSGLRQVNALSQIVWMPKLDSGQTVRLTYQVQLLVPSGR